MCLPEFSLQCKISRGRRKDQGERIKTENRDQGSGIGKKEKGERIKVQGKKEKGQRDKEEGKSVEKESRYSCQDYREEMRLLGLKQRLAQENLSEEERRALIREIEKLESTMGMD